jgi:Ca-activated chloride channel family protein
MSALHFLSPDRLWTALALLPLIAATIYFSYRQRLKARSDWGEEKLIERFSKPINPVFEAVRGVAIVLAWTLIFVSWADPIAQNAPQTVRQGSMNLVAVVDVSKSMAAEDYRPVMPPKVVTNGKGQLVSSTPADQVVGPYGSRLDMAKWVISNQIMPSLEHNKVGIVNYSGEAFVQAYPTDDYEALRYVMEHFMKIGKAPGGGSDYAAGLRAALDLIKAEPQAGKQNVILLFTDGGFDGKPEDLTKVIEDIRAAGVKIIVMGLGSPAPGIPIPVYSAGGQMTGYFQKDGKVINTAIDEAALQSLITLTGGELVRIDPANPKVTMHWERTVGGTKMEKHEAHVFQYPLAGGVAIFLLLIIFGVIRKDKKII